MHSGGPAAGTATPLTHLGAGTSSASLQPSVHSQSSCPVTASAFSSEQTSEPPCLCQERDRNAPGC